jgi:hypothetical protein
MDCRTSHLVVLQPRIRNRHHIRRTDEEDVGYNSQIVRDFAGTYVDEHECGIFAPHHAALAGLKPKRANATYAVGNISLSRIGRGLAKDNFVEEMVNEIHLCSVISLAAVDEAIECGIRHVVGCFPDICELCHGESTVHENIGMLKERTVNEVRDYSKIRTIVEESDQSRSCVNHRSERRPS